MKAYDFEIMDYNFKFKNIESIDSKLAQDFEKAVNSTIYHYGTCYVVFLQLGFKALEVILQASKDNLSSMSLLLKSNVLLNEKADKDFQALRKAIKADRENKLPRKLRNGW